MPLGCGAMAASARIVTLTFLAHLAVVAVRGRGGCGPIQARLADHPTDKPPEWMMWEDFWHVQRGVNELLHPVIAVAVQNIPCTIDTGCCTLNLFVRPNTSDAIVLEQVLIGGEYRFLHNISNFAPTAIIDAGANCGMTAVLFAINYPDATIIAVEPDDLNFRLLELNTARFGNVHLEKKGLWDKHTGLIVKRSDGNGFATTVQEVSRSHHPDIMATTIDLLMLKHGLGALDLLKVDIEGAEAVVFRSYRNPHTKALRHWLSSTQVIVAEVHDDESWTAMKEAFDARPKQGLYFQSDELHVWAFSEVRMNDGFGAAAI